MVSQWALPAWTGLRERVRGVYLCDQSSYQGGASYWKARESAPGERDGVNGRSRQSSVTDSTVTGGAHARDDTVTGISSLPDLEEAIWSARDLRGRFLRSLLPDAPMIASEEELATLNRTMKVGI